MPILLDLLSGSHSWSKSFAELSGWECVSIDNEPKFAETTIVCGILQWEVPERLYGFVDVVTIAVPCTAYSTANKKKSEEAQEATKLLWVRAFEIVDVCLQPNGVFVCENPSRTQSMGCKSRPVGDMEEIRPGMYKTEVNYCRYSEPPEYRPGFPHPGAGGRLPMARRGRVLWHFFVPLGGACPPSGAKSRRRPLECVIHHHHHHRRPGGCVCSPAAARLRVVKGLQLWPCGGVVLIFIALRAQASAAQRSEESRLSGKNRRASREEKPVAQ